MNHPSEQTLPARAQLNPSAWALRINGALLLIAGLTALVADLVGYFFAAGPFANLSGQPLAVGAVEAHGLAALIGLLLVRGATAVDHRFWHVVALSVHLFLAACNLLFWDVYALMGVPAVGIGSTAAHLMLFSVQLACLARLRVRG
jgi:uncharacterized membrane protein